MRGKGWVVAASAWLILTALGHTWGHWIYFQNVAGFDPELRALYDGVVAVRSGSRDGAHIWGLLRMFSSSFTLLLLLGGITGLVVVGSRPSADVVRRLAGFNALFWVAALIVLLSVYPVIQSVVISSGAAALYGVAWWRGGEALPESAPGSGSDDDP